MLLFQGNIEMMLATSSCADTQQTLTYGAKACLLVFATDLENKVSIILSAECKCVQQGGVALPARLGSPQRLGIVVRIDRKRLDQRMLPRVPRRNMHNLMPILYEDVTFLPTGL